MKFILTCPQCDSQDIDETVYEGTDISVCICNNCDYSDERSEFMKYYKEEE